MFLEYISNALGKGALRDYLPFGEEIGGTSSPGSKLLSNVTVFLRMSKRVAVSRFSLPDTLNM